MIIRALATLVASLRAVFVTELEKNPQAIRNGAAAVACVALAAAAMPAISHHAAEQRADALWAARANSLKNILLAEMEAQANAKAGGPPSATLPLTLAAFQPGETPRIALRGVGAFDRADLDAHALSIRAGLRDRAALQGVAPFQPARLGAARRNQRERHCLAEAIYYEARGEGRLGQAAVAEVVLNRVRSEHYPDTVCDVVYQGSWRSTGCQFTFTCDGSKGRAPHGEAWRRANLIAKQAMIGLARPLTERATHYHTTAVNPYWSVSLIQTTRIGAHIFYRFPSRRERALAYAQSEPPAIEAATAELPLEEVALDLPQGEGAYTPQLRGEIWPLPSGHVGAI